MPLITETILTPGLLATVVTSLEMMARPAARPLHGADDDARTTGDIFVRLQRPDLDRYRDLYRRIGTEWLWSWRLAMADAQLAAIIHDPAVEVWTLHRAGVDEGLLELDFRRPCECELKLFGVSPALVGTRAGRWLMSRGIDTVWQRPIRRFWVHTCTFDHPRALAFYQRSGFTPFRRHVEIEYVARLCGLWPRPAARTGDQGSIWAVAARRPRLHM